MMRKFLDLFSVNDPGWGNSHNSGGSKDAKDGQGSDQAPKADPETNRPVETQPTNQPAKPDGPPDLDELWRDFNDRIAGIFGGKKKPGSTAGPASKPASKPNSTDIPPPSQRGGNGGGNNGGMNTPHFHFSNPFLFK